MIMFTAPFVSSRLMAEFLAVRAAITSALFRGLDSILVLSDLQVLIKTTNKKEMNLEIFGVLRDIYSVFSTFKSIAFKFIL